MNTLSLLLLLLLPVQLESARFTVSVNGERVGTEEFSVSKDGSGFVVRGHTRLKVDGNSVDVQSRMELDENLNPTFYEYRSQEILIRVRLASPVSEIEYTVDGQRTPYDVRIPTNGMIVDNNFFHHYLLLLYKVGREGGELPVFVPNEMQLGSVTVVPTGNLTYELDSSNLKLQATTDSNGRLLRLVLPDSNVVVER